MQNKLISELEKRRGARTWKDLAAELRVSPAYLSDVVNGKKKPGRKILECLGYTATIVYTKTKQVQP